MLSRIAKKGLLLGCLSLFFASFTFAAAKTIHITQDVALPGGQTLKAGVYEVVVNEKLDQVQFLQDSKVVVTHACKCITQEKKNKYTELQLDQGPGNSKVLQEIRLAGETRIITLPS